MKWPISLPGMHLFISAVRSTTTDYTTHIIDQMKQEHHNYRGRGGSRAPHQLAK
uniref:Uncharacterized protein n=1 Tax=Aegilops tauschii subsp. strangulata TaxID=200361 RepID=A0A453LDI4_AEGTS